jgi:hypothetical protein
LMRLAFGSGPPAKELLVDRSKYSTGMNKPDERQKVAFSLVTDYVLFASLLNHATDKLR